MSCVDQEIELIVQDRVLDESAPLYLVPECVRHPVSSYRSSERSPYLVLFWSHRHVHPEVVLVDKL
jgi:hypothetical protein